MIEIARADHPGIDFRVDSCTELATLEDGQFDLVIANYVLMDTPDLEATVRAFARVLKPGGAAVLVFSHPCFPQGGATVSEDGREVSYRWDFPYFEPRKCTDPPWGHFKTDFLWFHRPLSDYWKAFAAAGFAVVGFEEPRVTEDRYHLAESEKKLRNSKTRPYSVAFKLQKPPSSPGVARPGQRLLDLVEVVAAVRAAVEVRRVGAGQGGRDHLVGHFRGAAHRPPRRPARQRPPRAPAGSAPAGAGAPR